MNMAFRAPEKAIRTLADLNHFKQSKTYFELMSFIRLCNDAVTGVRVSSLQQSGGGSDIVDRIVAILQQMATWVDDFPPLDEPMRFGNKAFRQWYQKLEQEASGMVNSILRGSEHEAATVELVPYLLASFGHPSRIDYGTGHETTFVVWLCCLYKLGSLSKDDLAPSVLKIFHSYLQVMRRLQSVYMLEPAGSHGVWGLDDYHCLPFLWGSAQLIDHPSIKPLDVLDEGVLGEGKDDYLYLGAIDFIRSLKKGAAFGECCPMLNDIAHLPSWKKVNTGMLRLYEEFTPNVLDCAQGMYWAKCQSYNTSYTAPYCLALGCLAQHPPEVSQEALLVANHGRKGVLRFLSPTQIAMCNQKIHLGTIKLSSRQGRFYSTVPFS